MPLIDVIAPISLDVVVVGRCGAGGHARRRAASGSKPFAVEGLNDAHRRMGDPGAGQRYGAFQAGVQLANRTGALNEIEFSEFVVKAQAFADAVDGTPEFPDMLDEVARARELDQFASGHDAQLGFTLRARRAAWSPGYVQQTRGPARLRGRRHAGAHGAAGQRARAARRCWACRSTPRRPWPTTRHRAPLREVTLSLDVAQVPRSEQPFVRLREAAMALAEAMDGVITDDDGQPLRADAMDAHRCRPREPLRHAGQRDLAAGSALARRLFPEPVTR